MSEQHIEEHATAVPTFSEVMASYIDASEKANRYLSQLGRVEEQLADACARIAELERAVDDARRLERIHQALNLWCIVEDSEAGPQSAEDRAMDEAYRNAAAWILADTSRNHAPGDANWWDLATDPTVGGLAAYPRLIEAARVHTRTTTAESTGEVDRAVRAADAARRARAARADGED